MSTRRPILLSHAKPLLGKTHDRNTTPPSFSFFVLKDASMPSRKTSQRLNLAEQVLLKGVLAMVACVRCTRQQKECRLSSLSQKCGECIRTGKKCEPAEPVVNFGSINRAMEKLKQEEIETEAAWEAANEIARVKQSKLKRLRAQKRFLKEKEQRMFDKGLNDVEELERLEDLEKVQEVQRSTAGAPSIDDFLNANISLETLNWLPSGPFSDGTVAEGSCSS